MRPAPSCCVLRLGSFVLLCLLAPSLVRNVLARASLSRGKLARARRSGLTNNAYLYSLHFKVKNCIRRAACYDLSSHAGPCIHVTTATDDVLGSAARCWAPGFISL
ncbi:hypothetical protein B0H11DRAFT_1992918 [Mycena galericulata]|nr:hypothetical protein B0H11DRAFT_1992918 [Mycena galericulata]